jgi:DHA1 family inner membrane transport protein
MNADVPAAPSIIPDLDTAPPIPIAPIPSYPSKHRVLIALCCGTFVASLVTIAPPPLFPQIARDLQVSVPLLGQIMTAMLLLSAALGLIFGPLSDRFGYHRLILAGLVAAAATLLTFGLAPSFLLLVLASATGAMADAAVNGPSLALAGTHFEGSAGRRAVGWTNGAAALSAIVGVPVLTVIGAVAGWRAAFVAVGLAALAIVLVAFVGLPRHHHPAGEPFRLDALLGPYRPLLREPTMRRLYAARALSSVCWYGLLTYLGAFLANVLGMQAGHIGLVYMAGGTAFFLGSVAVGGPLVRVPARMLVVAGYAIMALLMGIAFSARLGPLGTAALIAVSALAMGVGVVGLIALFLDETPSGAGTTLTLSGAVFNLGGATGGAIGGALLAFSGYDAVAIGLPLFGLAAALLGWRPARARTEGIANDGMGKGIGP